MLRRFWLRIVAAVVPGARILDLEREIQAHLHLLEADLINRGHSPEEARIAARRAFGGIDQVKERHHDTRSFRWIEDIPKDVRYAFRSLSRSPTFALASIVTVAVGIGATTTIYSVVEAILLRPLPFADSERLVLIREPELPRGMFGTDSLEYLEWRKRMATLVDVAAQGANPQVILATPRGTARLAAGVVSTNYFDLQNAQPALGRLLHPSDESNPHVVVLSDGMWRRHFQGAPDVVGSTIEIRGNLVGAPSNLGAAPGGGATAMTVVGVLPPEFDSFGRPFDFYTPLVGPAGGRPIGVTLLGRFRTEATLTAAQQEAMSVGDAIRPRRPEGSPAMTMPRFQVDFLTDRLVEPVRPALKIFLVAVIVVLLIVCANVANLLLARGMARGKEMSLRLAIGASRGRIVRQVLTECLVMALSGGLTGALIAFGGVTLIKRLATVDSQGVFRISFGGDLLPRLQEVRIDAHMFLFAILSAIAVSLIFSALPVLQLTRVGHLNALSSQVTDSRNGARLRMLLVGAQVVLATVLLVSAALLANSFVKLSRVDKGYDPTNALAFYLVLPPQYSTERKASVIESVLSALRRHPGVSEAGFAYAGILLGVEDLLGTFVPPGRSLEEMQLDPMKQPRMKSLSAGYLESMGATLVKGRLLDGRDSPTSPLTVIINRTVANQFFPGRDPIGSFMTWRLSTEFQVEIVGVVEDIRQARLAAPAYPELFMDYRQVRHVQEQLNASKQRTEQMAFGFMAFGVRTRSNPDRFLPNVHQIVKSVDPNAGIDAIQSMDKMVGASTARQRFYATVLGIFASVAALLACIGIYGVLAYSVAQRTREIGVRMALGAERRQVITLILRRGILVSVVGIIVGLLGAAAGAKYLGSMLFGIQPRDPWTFAAVALSFSVIATVASYLPARRATRVDPLVALRVE